MHRFLRALAASVLLSSALVACAGDDGPPTGTVRQIKPRPSLPDSYRPSGHAAAGDVVVHLFDWRWDDIATECETYVGPAGFRAVQVSPPQEHSITPSRDWSERYQPVSYSLARSRSGTEAEFRDMVGRCRAAGVDIIVDAVINHMTNFPSPGVGSAGTAYSKYEYPGLYTASDFHAPCGISDWRLAAQVQDCELLGLPDLNTGSATVQQKIADYLIGLARLGVAGFRVDAAKHIQQVELDQIITRVNDALVAEGRPRPYFFLEVIQGYGEELQARDYFGEGYASGGASDITEFIFVGVGDKFRHVGGQRISQLDPNGPPGAQFSAQAWGMMPSDKAVVFLQNHDTQHNGGISYRDGQVFRLANVWMLAQPYGYPSVLSSFAFDYPSGNSMGPPSDGDGWTLHVTCASSLETATVGQWVCEHRDPYVANMVRFRKVVAGTDVNHWWSDGNDALAFSRGDRGFVAVNRESATVTATVGTGLAAGTYCDVITGGKSGSACAGTSVTVGADGTIALTLPAMSAVAVTVESRL